MYTTEQLSAEKASQSKRESAEKKAASNLQFEMPFFDYI